MVKEISTGKVRYEKDSSETFDVRMNYNKLLLDDISNSNIIIDP